MDDVGARPYLIVQCILLRGFYERIAIHERGTTYLAHRHVPYNPSPLLRIFGSLELFDQECQYAVWIGTTYHDRKVSTDASVLQGVDDALLVIAVVDPEAAMKER